MENSICQSLTVDNSIAVGDGDVMHFQDQLEIIREISLDDTRVYEIVSVIKLLDDNPSYDYTDAQLLNELPVEVLDEAKKFLGYANVYRSGNRLMARMFLDYASPERLSIEAGHKLYPRTLINREVGEPTCNEFGVVENVLELQVQYILIGSIRPVDGRIEPLGALVLP